MPMTDPHDGLVSFQEAYAQGLVDVHPCPSDARVFVHIDEPTPGVRRITYVHITRDDEVLAMATFVGVEPVDTLPCFQVGYAVDAKSRGNGLATATLKTGITELLAGLARRKVNAIDVEAVISTENAASQRVAEKVGLLKREETVDEVSGEPAVQYVGTYRR